MTLTWESCGNTEEPGDQFADVPGGSWAIGPDSPTGWSLTFVDKYGRDTSAFGSRHLYDEETAKRCAEYKEQDRQAGRLTRQKIEMIVSRDPDGPNEVSLFIDGVRVTNYSEYSVDTGSGYDWKEWRESRDEKLLQASPAVREVLIGWYSDPPGGKYIDDVPTDKYGQPKYLARLPKEIKTWYRELRASRIAAAQAKGAQ